MKTTVDIPETELQDAMRYARAKTKRAAILTAVADFNRRQRMAELVKYSGTSTSLMTNAAIEARDAEDSMKSRRSRRAAGRRR
jgi:hypothetical protein